MEEKIIMLGSITYALKAKEILKVKGIRADVIKTPKELSSCGCNHSIRVDGKVEEVESILKQNNITMQGRAG